MALAADRSTDRRDGVAFEFPVKDNVKIFAGALTVIESTGYANGGSVATTLKSVGVCIEFVDNTGVGHAAGAVKVKVRRGVFRLKNSSAGDLIALADVGADCYVVDDETVAKTNGGNTRSVADKIRDVDSAGVWVEF